MTRDNDLIIDVQRKVGRSESGKALLKRADRFCLFITGEKEVDYLKKVLSVLAKDLWVVLLDLVAVNASYYLALLIRFYVNFTLRPVAVNEYLPAWMSFAPWYSLLAIMSFAGWKLYGGMWRFAGVNDMNRIIMANITTNLIHIAGTLIFFTRMPITYYVIGGGLQFFFVVLIRFSYRILLVEKKKLKRVEKVPALVVGSGNLGRKVVKHLEENTPYRTVAILSTSRSGRSMDGIPMIGFEELGKTIAHVQAVFIANNGLSEADRQKIKEVAGEREVVDFTGALTNIAGSVPLAALLSLTSGSVTLIVDGKKTKYCSGQEALEAVKERMDVKSISGDIEVELKKAVVIDNSWMENYTAVTGEEFIMRGF